MSDVLLIDYNGVIAHDEALHYEAFRGVLEGHDLTLDTRTYLSDYMGLDDRSAFVEAWRRAQRTVTGELLRLLIEDKAARYAALTAAGVPLVPGAAAFVRAAAARWPVAVVSGALRREIDAGLAAAGLVDVVTVVIAAEDTRATKPDPGGYLLALRRLGTERARRAVVIEDSLPGLAAARAIGAGCVLLATSLPLESLAGGDARWSDLAGHQPAELEPLFRKVKQ